MSAAAMLRRAAWPTLLAALALACSACATRGAADNEIPPATLATPEAAAAKADALPLPDGMTDETLPAWLAAERARIADERSAAQAARATQEAACWRRFAVNACLRRARITHRAAMHALLQQELALGAHERALRARETAQRLEKKAAPRGSAGGA